MKVRVEWEDHDRFYRFPLDKFLKELGVDVPQKQIEKVADKLLRTHE